MFKCAGICSENAIFSHLMYKKTPYFSDSFYKTESDKQENRASCNNTMGSTGKEALIMKVWFTEQGGKQNALLVCGVKQS